MSSISRRACYKCGEAFHLAEACPSAERLCYNCKQPGHESNACPLPRNSEAKQCYHCLGRGHVMLDCPTLRLSGGAGGGRCYSCNMIGHVARDCPNPSGPTRGGFVGRGAFRGARGAFGGPRGGFGGRPTTCFRCGEKNHISRDCQALAIKCYACGLNGHLSKDCTSPNGGPLNSAGKICYSCQEAGHISRDCPKKGANGDMIGAGVDLSIPSIAPGVVPIA